MSFIVDVIAVDAAARRYKVVHIVNIGCLVVLALFAALLLYFAFVPESS